MTKNELGKEQSLKKHVAAIHAANPLTLIQRKLANALLFYAYPSLLTQEEHTISIRDLCSLIGFESHAIEKIKEALKKLMSTVIEWNLVDKEKETKENYWGASTLLASVEIKRGECRYAYSKHLRELLYQPEIFATLDMSVLKSFKSAYGLVLYENCMRFKNINQTKWFEIAVFRKLMGVADHKYVEFSDFKRRVIDSAVEEVNQNKLSRIALVVEFKQEGRAVKAIKFHISEKPVIPINIPLTPNDEKVFATLTNELAIDSNEARSFIDKYGATKVLEKIKYITATKTFQSGEMRYPSQYLKRALEDDYKVQKSSGDLLWEAKQKKEAEEAAARIEERRIQDIKREYSHYRSESIMRRFLAYSEKEKKVLLKKFVAEINETPLLLDLYRRSGIDGQIVRAKFISFFIRDQPHVQGDIMNFEDYCDTKNMTVDEV